MSGTLTTKAFEIRDRMTFIPVIATRLASEHAAESYLLGLAGYGQLTQSGEPWVLVLRLVDSANCFDPRDWGFGSRTMVVAHDYIEKNWDLLETGSVIDVEYILGEAKVPKFSQRLETLL